MLTDISPHSAKAALIRQDSSRFPRSDRVDWSSFIMTYPAPPATTLPPDVALATAQTWCEEAADLNRTAQAFYEAAASLAKAADHLLSDLGSRPPRTQVPEGVADFAAYQARRRAVSR